MKIKKISYNTVYIFGSYDRLLVKVLSFKDFDSEIILLPDGTINLPRIGSIYISGLSVLDAQKKINAAFKKIIKDPIIYVDLLETRPLRISVTGEVQKPEFMASESMRLMFYLIQMEVKQTTLSYKGFPRVVEAIQKAGGITIEGDLRNVELFKIQL